MPVRHEDHGGVTVPVAVTAGGFHQPFHLSFSQMFTGPQVPIGEPLGCNCSFYDGWRDQPQARFGHIFRPPGIDNCSYKGHFMNSASKGIFLSRRFPPSWMIEEHAELYWRE